MLPNINKHWNIFVPTSVMLKVSQTIYKHDVSVNSKINENAPKVTSILWHCLIWQMHIQLYLLLETGSKPIIGFVLVTT